MELYPSSTIKSIKEDDVKFWTLFEKCTMACFASFCRNHSTFVIWSANFFLAPSFQCFFGFSNLIDLYGQSISGLSQILFAYFLKNIDASFLEEVEDRELPNSCTIVEAILDEIPPTSSFNSQMPQLEDVESPSSHTVFEVNLNEIPLTSNVDSHSTSFACSKGDSISCDFQSEWSYNCHTL